MVQGKINRVRHTDHPAGRHSIQTNQWPPPPSPNFLWAECPSCRPTNSVKALKADSYTHMKSLARWWHAALIICVMLSDVNLHCPTWHAVCRPMLCCCLIYHHICGNVTTVCLGWLIASDIAIFVLKRDVKLQLTNFRLIVYHSFCWL